MESSVFWDIVLCALFHVNIDSQRAARCCIASLNVVTTSNIIFQLNTCRYSPYITSSLTRGCVFRLQLLLAIASAVILRSESRGSHDHILLSQIRDFPNLEGQVPVFISSRNIVAPIYHQALDSLFVSSYDSQGYGGGGWPHLHTGLHLVESSLILWQTISLSWDKAQSGAYDRIFVTVGQLRVCSCGVLSLTRGWVFRLQLLLVFASAVNLGSESGRLFAFYYLRPTRTKHQIQGFSLSYPLLIVCSCTRCLGNMHEPLPSKMDNSMSGSTIPAFRWCLLIRCLAMDAWLRLHYCGFRASFHNIIKRLFFVMEWYCFLWGRK
jgi:hypothetical protein